MTIEQYYNDLLLKLSFDKQSIHKYWYLLTKNYTGSSRYYHNLDHLKEMISCFETYKNQLQFPDEVLYSIFYHDIIYKNTRKDNELKSTQLAVDLLLETTTINKQIVFDMIIATKDHVCKGVEDEKWLIDFDLKILAKDWEDYKVYFKQIRKEYSIYPDFMYNPGRKKALEHFLEKEFIFQTETFRELFESKARNNIQKEINLL